MMHEFQQHSTSLSMPITGVLTPKSIKMEPPSPIIEAKQLGLNIIGLRCSSITKPTQCAIDTAAKIVKSHSHKQSLNTVFIQSEGQELSGTGFQDANQELSRNRKTAAVGVRKDDAQDFFCNYHEQDSQDTRESTRQEPCKQATTDTDQLSNRSNAEKQYIRKIKRSTESPHDENNALISARKARRRPVRIAESKSAKVPRAAPSPTPAPELMIPQRHSHLTSSTEQLRNWEHERLANIEAHTTPLSLHANSYLQQDEVRQETGDGRAMRRKQKEIKRSNMFEQLWSREESDKEADKVRGHLQASQRMANHELTRDLAFVDSRNSSRPHVVDPANKYTSTQLRFVGSRCEDIRSGDQQWALQQRAPPTSASSSGTTARRISAWVMASSDPEISNSHDGEPEQLHTGKHLQAPSSSISQNLDRSASAELQEIDEEASRRVKKSNIERFEASLSGIEPLSEDFHAFNSENARKEKGSSQTKTTLLKASPTPWGAQYWEAPGSSLPDYGDSQKSCAIAVPRPGNKMKHLLSGPKPVNTLKNESHGQTVPTKSRKIFSLTGTSDFHNPPSKRQKTGGSGQRNNAESHVIDLDELEASSTEGPRGKRADLYGKGSGSRTCSGRGSRTLDGRPSEIQRVNETVSFPNSRSRRRSVEVSRKSNRTQAIGANEFGKSGQPQPTMINHGRKRDEYSFEDESEPMGFTCNEELLDPLHDNFRKIPRNNFDIEIPSDKPYEGVANFAAARKTPSLRTRIDKDLRQKPYVSEYFKNDRGFQRRGSKDSDSSHESHSSPTSSRIESPVHNNGASLSKRQKRLHKYEDDSDFEMLDSKAVATNLLQAQTGMPMKHGVDQRSDMRLSVSAKGRALAQQALAASDSVQNHSLLPKKSDSGTKKDQDVYSMKQMFSETGRWLILDKDSSGRVVLDSAQKLLIFYGDNQRDELSFAITSIAKIQMAPMSSKLCIHRHRESLAGAGTRICLEIGSCEQVDEFLKSLSQIESGFQLVHEEGPRLEKIFAAQLEKSPTQARKSPFADKSHYIDELDDEDRGYAASNGTHATERKESVKAQRQKRMIDALQQNDEEGTDELNASEAQTRHPARKTAASNVVVRRKDQQLEPNAFYGTLTRNIADKAQPSGTRSSTRMTNAEFKARTSARQRSSSPEKWTSVNKDWKKNWVSSIIYPPEGNQKATVDMQDIERLDDGEFLNDNLISFYLRWLEEHNLERQRADRAKRIYFHNTFFYTSLTKGKPGQRGINYEAVQRWTAKVDLLSYDYIIVPVNEATHWYVVIICNASKLLVPKPAIEADASNTVVHAEDENPRAVVTEKGTPRQKVSSREGQISQNSRDSNAVHAPMAQVNTKVVDSLGEEDVELVSTVSPPVSNSEAKQTPTKKGKRKSAGPPPRKFNPNEPKIIALDSLACPRSPTCINLKDYLIAEIKNKKGIDVLPPAKIGMTAKCLPIQTNFYDCGVFLLDYIEKFLIDPDDFIRKVTQGERDNDIQWRTGPEMRAHIRNTILNLQEKQGADFKRNKALRARRRSEKKSKVMSSADQETLKTDTAGALTVKNLEAQPQQPTQNDKVVDNSALTKLHQIAIPGKGNLHDLVDQQQPADAGQKDTNGNTGAHTSDDNRTSKKPASPTPLLREIPESPNTDRTGSGQMDKTSLGTTRSSSPGDQLRSEVQQDQTTYTPGSQVSTPFDGPTTSIHGIRQATTSPITSVKNSPGRARSSSLESIEKDRFMFETQPDLDMPQTSDHGSSDSLGQGDDVEMLLSNREKPSTSAAFPHEKTVINVFNDVIAAPGSELGEVRDKEGSAEAVTFYDLTTDASAKKRKVNERHNSMLPMTPQRDRQDSLSVPESRQVQTEASSNSLHKSASKVRTPIRSQQISRMRDGADTAIVGRHLRE